MDGLEDIMEGHWIVFVLATILCSSALGKKVHYIHWNRNNPMFRIDNTDHIVDVNRGNLPWEYDQVNLICPVSKPGTQYPEKHVIYSVSKEEYESCRITNPKPRIVAICNQPHRLMYFTITFRSFTPTPGGLEFRPGQDYYFISTSSRDDLHRRVGGGCSTNNMRMIFKVHDSHSSASPDDENDLLSETLQSLEDPHVNAPRVEITSTTTTTPSPLSSLFGRRGSGYAKSRGDYIYYYHPRDLVELEKNAALARKNEVWRNEALRYTSSTSSSVVFSMNVCLLTLTSSLVLFLGLR